MGTIIKGRIVDSTARLDQLQRDLELVMKVKADMVAAISELFDPQIVDLQQEIDVQVANLKSWVTQGRRWLRRHGRTITILRPDGSELAVLKHRLISRSVITVGDELAVVQELRSMRGGHRYLRIEHKLDREKLAAAPSSILARLAKCGFRVGRQEHVTLQVGGRKLIVLHRRRYPR